jgi:cysteinyl-tRNA synthetase
MHNGFIRVDNEKMSKSLGNFFTIREVLSKYDPEVVRFFIARTHYRSPINYSDQNLEDAKHSLARLYTALRGIPAAASEVDWTEVHAKRFHEAMNDDFNTSEAVAVLFDLANELNRSHDAGIAKLLKSLGGLLGLLQRDPVAFLQGGITGQLNVKAEDASWLRVGLSLIRPSRLKNSLQTARLPVRRKTLPSPTASGKSCSTRASFWKTRRRVLRGAVAESGNSLPG